MCLLLFSVTELGVLHAQALTTEGTAYKSLPIPRGFTWLRSRWINNASNVWYTNNGSTYDYYAYSSNTPCIVSSIRLG